jgi:hypothetical protein
VARVIVANPRAKTDKIDASGPRCARRISCPRSGCRTLIPCVCGATTQPSRPAPHGRNWLSRQPLPDDELMAIERHFRELDRLGEDLGMLDRKIAQAVIDDPAVKRLLAVSSRTMSMNLRSGQPNKHAHGRIVGLPTSPKVIYRVGLQNVICSTAMKPIGVS